jgi:hypothetical protein
MRAVLAANLAGYKGKVTKKKSNACGFGAVITRILRHVGVDCENQQVALDRSNNIAWNYLDVKNLVSKEFIAGPHSRIDRDGPYVYVFQDRAKKTLYCHLPQIGLTALLSEAAVEFLPPATALVDKPSFFTPKYQTKGKGVVGEEGQDEAAQAIPDDSQPHQLLPSDSSQYKLQTKITGLERTGKKDAILRFDVYVSLPPQSQPFLQHADDHPDKSPQIPNHPIS